MKDVNDLMQAILRWMPPSARPARRPGRAYRRLAALDEQKQKIIAGV